VIRSRNHGWRHITLTLTIGFALAASPMPAEAAKAKTPAPAPIQTAMNDAYAKYKDIQEGKNADYIPALAKVDPRFLGSRL
jgi:glutaminase